MLHHLSLGSLGNWLRGGNLQPVLFRLNPVGNCRKWNWTQGEAEMHYSRKEDLSSYQLEWPLRSPDVRGPSIYAPLPTLPSAYT